MSQCNFSNGIQVRTKRCKLVKLSNCILLTPQLGEGLNYPRLIARSPPGARILQTSCFGKLIGPPACNIIDSASILSMIVRSISVKFQSLIRNWLFFSFLFSRTTFLMGIYALSLRCRILLVSDTFFFPHSLLIYFSILFYLNIRNQYSIDNLILRRVENVRWNNLAFPKKLNQSLL